MPLARYGNAAAATRLGFDYANGIGVPQSYEVAVDLYLRAAEQGDSRAQYLLGLMYDKGLGVPRDFILAHKWLNLAAGHASRRDRENFTKIRNAVAFKMSPEQIITAQRLAVEWVPQPRR
ncbi:MAG: tetratricopeptide repeat protein [Xanthobacteraceae bacterium]